MFGKIYLIALAVFVLVMAILTYYSASWLGSITRPQDVAENYRYFSNLNWYLLWISSMILLIAANAIAWKTRRFWAFWATFIYFAVFLVLQTFWLDRSFAAYSVQNGLAQSSFSLSPLIGAGLLIAVGFIIFFNQFLVLRLHEKMFAKEIPVERPIEDEIIIEDVTTKNET